MRKTCKNVSSFVGKRFNRFFSAVEVEGGGGGGGGWGACALAHFYGKWLLSSKKIMRL